MPAQPPEADGVVSAPVPRRPPGKHWPLDYDGEFNIPILGIALTVVMGVIMWSDLSRMRNPVEFWVCTVGLPILLGLPALLTMWEQRSDIRFRKWILANWNDIMGGTAELDGAVVNPDTELIRYQLMFSLVFVNAYFLSRPVLENTPSARRTRWISIAVCGLAGWWSMRGFFFTPVAIKRNLLEQVVPIRLADIANATVSGQSLHEENLDT